MALDQVKGSKATYLRAVFDGLKLSKTAMDIFTYLDKQERPYDVIVLASGENYGQMLTNMDRSGVEAERARGKYNELFGTRTIAKPVVLWNPDYRFSYYGDVEGVTMRPDGTIVQKSLGDLTAGDFYYKYQSFNRDIQVPSVRLTLSEMPAWVVLYHELGHVKQYYEGVGNQQGAEATWNIRLADTSEIEADNLARHENPMCSDIKIALREHYKHMKNGFQFVLNSFIGKKQPALRIAESKEQRILQELELRKEAVDNNLNQAKSGFFA